MQSTLELKVNTWHSLSEVTERGARWFAATVICGTLLSALFTARFPLQVSIITVFLFAGPHNWFELRYFLMRLPVRLGKSRNFFVTAFTGLGLLTIIYVSLPLIYKALPWSNEAWLLVLACWNTLLLTWLCALVLLRGKQKPRSDWSWIIPAGLALCAINWFRPDFFSLGLVYIHPLIALWFLDRHLARNRRDWLITYRRCLALVPLVLAGLIFLLWRTTPLAEDNGLFWRITQHSGAELLPNISSHLLVSVHLFLEMLHYGVWLLALTIIGPITMSKLSNRHAPVWDLRSIPLVRHPRGFPKLVAALLLISGFLVVTLWIGFSVDYSTTRDIYFTVAIVHVMAEVPFLLRML